jgi:hypothetical protein
MIVETDMAYAAGLMDGEGSICIRRHIYKTSGHNIPSFTVYVEIRMTNWEAVDFICNKFGGHLTEKGRTNKGKVIYDWKIYSKKAISFLEMISPYLKCKHRQAMIAKDFQKLPFATKHNRDEVTKKRDTMRNLISILNQTSHSIVMGGCDDSRTSICQ